MKSVDLQKKRGHKDLALNSTEEMEIRLSSRFFSRFGILLVRVGVLALEGLDDQAHLDGLGRDLDPADLTVHNRTHLLHVGFEFAFGDAGGLFTNTAQIFRFTAAGNAFSAGCLFA